MPRRRKSLPIFVTEGETQNEGEESKARNEKSVKAPSTIERSTMKKRVAPISDDDEFDPFAFEDDNEAPEAVSAKEGMKQANELAEQMESEAKKRAEAQKNKKKQYQKQIPEIDESEKLPEDLLEDADLNDFSDEEIEQEDLTPLNNMKRPEHQYFIERDEINRLRNKKINSMQGTKLIPGVSVVDINSYSEGINMPQKRAMKFLHDSLYGGKQKRISSSLSVSKKRRGPSITFKKNELIKKRDIKIKKLELKQAIKISKGKARDDLVEQLKHLKSAASM